MSSPVATWIIVAATILVPPLILYIWAVIYRRRHPPQPELVEAGPWIWNWRWPRSGLPAFLSSAVFWGVVFALRSKSLSTPGRVGLSILVFGVFLWFLIEFFREARSEDERTRYVQGVACTMAFYMYVGVSLTMWGLDPGPQRIRDGLFWMPFWYSVGLFFGKGRYVTRKLTPATG